MDNIILIIITIVMFLLGQTIQALSLSMVVGVLSKLFDQAERIHSSLRTIQISRFWHGFRISTIVLLFLILNSLFQISVWAVAFVLVGQFSDYQEAFYHSAVNFGTLGYGDIVMESPWRLLGAMEAISGILMLGLSTAMLSNVFSKLLQLYKKR